VVSLILFLTLSLILSLTLTLIEFIDHVPFESWSSYPEEEFGGADDAKWEEDQWMEEAMIHVQSVAGTHKEYF
jgi:hypothetical protein